MNDQDLAVTFFRTLRDTIERVADIAYQRRVWLGDIPNKRDSFVETYYALEMINIDLIRENRKQLSCAADEWEVILRFLVKFFHYCCETDDYYAEEKILADPRWGEVVAAAKDALVARP